MKTKICIFFSAFNQMNTYEKPKCNFQQEREKKNTQNKAGKKARIIMKKYVS